MICHQKIIRDKQAEIEHKESLFGAYWENIDLSRSNAIIRKVSHTTAKEIILKYEWLGTMPSVFTCGYGLFFGWSFAAVECFTEAKLGSLYSFNKEPAICLCRGACVHWAPKWSASFLISNSIKLLDKKYHYVLAYSDTDANEIGTVYQACNWYCVGEVSNKFWQRPDGKRFDRSYHRNLVRGRDENGKEKVFGDDHVRMKEKMLKEGWKIVTGGKRYKYAFPLGSGRDFRSRKKYLESISIPYPKREVKQCQENS